MSHSPTRVAAAALLGATATACLVAIPAPADAAKPLKNTTYKAEINDTVYELTGSVTIKIGNDKGKVAKITLKLSCPEGSFRMVRKNLRIDDAGHFSKVTGSLLPDTQIDGDFTTKHQVKGSFFLSSDKDCGGNYQQYTAKD